MIKLQLTVANVIKSLMCTVASLILFSGNTYAVMCNIGLNDAPVDVKPKTITIHNNSGNTIYPVIMTGQNSVNEWLQGCLRTTDPHPTKYVYKLYINQDTGLGDGKSITVTLPLYSNIDGVQGFDKYITWWNGGRVVIADNNELLAKGREKEKDRQLGIVPPGLSCVGDKTSCDLTVYASDSGFPENLPGQLSEYTFADSIFLPLKPGEQPQPRMLQPGNVGYNISYVDHVYLPIAITPKGNRYIGYSGSVQPLPTFRMHLEDFLKVGNIGEGWPVYNMKNLKLPSAYNAFTMRNGTLVNEGEIPVQPSVGAPPVLTVLKCKEGLCSDAEKTTLRFGKSIQDIQNLWGSCLPQFAELRKEEIVCPDQMKQDLTAIEAFFAENYAEYRKIFNAQCLPQGIRKEPIPYTNIAALEHIYGWVPFNEGCGSNLNKLAGPNTNNPLDPANKKHAQMQSLYIHNLQYSFKKDPSMKTLFNPYVQLIHSDNYLNMDAYAFSVDDAVGFMSELGDGLIFTVGGPEGLENKEKFTYKTGFTVKLGVTLDREARAREALLKSYGACVFGEDKNNPECMTVNQDVKLPAATLINGFRIGTFKNYPVKIAFTDEEDNVYSFVVLDGFGQFTQVDEAIKKSTGHEVIKILGEDKWRIIKKDSCGVKDKNGNVHPMSNTWCNGFDPNRTVEKEITKNFISCTVTVKYLK